MAKENSKGSVFVGTAGNRGLNDSTRVYASVSGTDGAGYLTGAQIKTAALEVQALIDATKPESFLAGVNISGAEFGYTSGATLPGTYNTDYFYPTEQSINYFIDNNLGDIFRLPFRWERLQKTLGGDFDAAEQARLETVIEYITRQGKYVIIDPHNYAGYKISGTEYKIGSDTCTEAHYVDFMEKLGALASIKNNPLVIICLMNEPSGAGITNDVWFPAAQAAVNALRAAGVYNRIHLPFINYSTAANFFAGSSHTYIEAFTDPINNWVMDTHQYLDADYNGNAADVVNHTIGIEKVSPLVEWCRMRGIKLFVGETNCGDYNSTTSEAAVKALLKFYDYLIANQDVVEGVTFWGAGVAWPADYYFVLYSSDYTTVPARTAALAARKKTASTANAAAVMTLDFRNGEYVSSGVDIAVSTVLTTTQAGTTYHLTREGEWTTVAPNTLRISTMGLWTEVTKTNYLASLLTTPVTLSNVTVESRYPAPDGTNNAHALKDDATNSTHMLTISSTKLTGLSVGDVVCYSNFAKKYSGDVEYGWMYTNNPNTKLTIDLGTSQSQSTRYYQDIADGWMRPWVYLTYGTSVGNILYGFQPDSSPTQSHIPDAYVGTGSKHLWWMRQLEKGLFPSSPIYLSAFNSNAVRASDAVRAAGDLLTLLGGTNFTLIFTVSKPPEAAVDLPLVVLDPDGTPIKALYRTDDYKIASDIGSTQESTAAGATNKAFRDHFKIAVSVRNTGTERVVVGGDGIASIGHDVTVPAISAVGIGPFEGFVEKIEVFNTFYDTAALDTLLIEQ